MVLLTRCLQATSTFDNAGQKADLALRDVFAAMVSCSNVRALAICRADKLEMPCNSSTGLFSVSAFYPGQMSPTARVTAAILDLRREVQGGEISLLWDPSSDANSINILMPASDVILINPDIQSSSMSMTTMEGSLGGRLQLAMPLAKLKAVMELSILDIDGANPVKVLVATSSTASFPYRGADGDLWPMRRDSCDCDGIGCGQ